MRVGLRSSVVLMLALASGCSTLAPSRNRPEWIANPKRNDSAYMYRLGHASGRPSAEDAQKAAVADALGQISQSILTDVSVSGTTVQLSSNLKLRGASIMAGCVHGEQSMGSYRCWVQVMYPMFERNKIVKRIELGEELNQIWGNAKSLMNRRAYGDALSALLRIVRDYDKALGTSIRLDETKLLLGDAYLGQKDALEARKWYEDVARQTDIRELKTKAEARIAKLPKPPRFWPMYDRFSGGRVAILACVRDGDTCRTSDDLSGVLMQDCREARLRSANIGKQLTAGQIAGVFDGSNIQAAVAAARRQKAAIILAVLLDIDPKKRGTRTKAFGVDTPTIDTRIKYRVISVGRNAIAFSGNFKEIAGKPSAAANTALAQRSANILIRNYLVPKCPMVR